MTPVIIAPTVGRKVWFRPNGITGLQKAGTPEYTSAPLSILDGQPLDATVVYVWNDRMVNLAVLDHYGHPFIATSVSMLQEGDEKPASGYYCEWMPYQKGQAAKAEAAQASEPSGCSITPMRDQLEYLLVSGAAARLAEAPHEAAAIATGIKNVLDALRPQPVLLNPHTGAARDPRDVASDPQAILCVKPGEPLKAAAITLPVVDPGPDSLERLVQNHSDERADKTGAALVEHDAITGLALRGLKSGEADSLEREIQAKADNGPRVTPQALQDEIVSEHYFTGGQGWSAANFGDRNPPAPLNLMTFCVLVLRNGFTVHGVSACASPENFNVEIGQRIARENAERQIWPLLGFRLRDSLTKGTQEAVASGDGIIAGISGGVGAKAA